MPELWSKTKWHVFMAPSVHCFNQSIVNAISRTVILFIGRISDMCLGMFAAMFRKYCHFFCIGTSVMYFLSLKCLIGAALSPVTRNTHISGPCLKNKKDIESPELTRWLPMLRV